MTFAILAALLTGSATVLQAFGARKAVTGTADPGAGALLGALHQWPFLAGLGMDMLGFGAELVALRTLPLFVVEAALASALAVTAVGASRMLHIQLRRVEWGAVIAVCCGLVVLALSAGREGAGEGNEMLRLAALFTAFLLVLAGWAVGHLTRGRVVALGLIAGLDFGLVGVSVRILPAASLAQLLSEPSAYALAIAGSTGFLFLISAMQSGSVTAATAAMVMGETIGPAVVGVLLLGDRTRHGHVPLTVVGFSLAIVGALTLARFGDAEQSTTAPA
jgi:hypothetical protein